MYNHKKDLIWRHKQIWDETNPMLKISGMPWSILQQLKNSIKTLQAHLVLALINFTFQIRI